jgi:SAM-dependent methyltransferase
VSEPITAESLHAQLERIERARLEADRNYNDALSALDRSVGALPELPHPPPGYDTTGLDTLNRVWDVLPDGPPRVDGSFKGRLRGFIWRLIGPPLETQRQFNSVLVDHLNRNVAVHEERRKAAASTIAVLGERIEAIARFQSHLLQYLQTITAYIDTRSRGAMVGAQVLNISVDAISAEFQRRWESQSVREARMSGEMEQLRATVEELRAAAVLAQQTSLSLKRDVERLVSSGAPVTAASAPAGTAAPSQAPDLNSFKYLGFENEFRGAVEEIRGRLEAYVPLFEGLEDVVDIGCGRGEFLDLLRAKGIRSRGIDINDAMVEESRARGLDVQKGDALSYLSSLPDASIGGVFAAQVIEHLPGDYLTALIEVAAQKIRPGGRVVFETINPTCWVAFFESYIRDITHVRPLHPETMQYLLRVSGFDQVRVQYSAPVSPEGRLAAVADEVAATDDPLLRHLIDVVNGNVRTLNDRLFGYQDYAVIGTR